MLHWGIDPALSACQSNAVPTELHPHPHVPFACGLSKSEQLLVSEKLAIFNAQSTVKAICIYEVERQFILLDPLRLSFLFINCGLWTLSCDFAYTINETLQEKKTLQENFGSLMKR